MKSQIPVLLPVGACCADVDQPQMFVLANETDDVGFWPIAVNPQRRLLQ
jgi:hypothetical protein